MLRTLMGRTARGLATMTLGLGLTLAAVPARAGGGDGATALGPSNKPTSKEDKIVLGSYKLLREFVNDEEKGIPSSLLREARGVAIFPRVVQGGFLVGGSRGHGILMIRDAKGAWTNPVFLTVTGGSFGLQAGAEGSEVLLVFRDLDTIRRLMSGKGSKLTFGAGASASIGPIGRGVAAGTDPKFSADILVYSRGKGAYAGAKLGGSMVHVDKKANAAYYADTGISVARVLGPESASLPRKPVVEQMHKILPAPRPETARSDKKAKKTSAPVLDDDEDDDDDQDAKTATPASSPKRG